VKIFFHCPDKAFFKVKLQMHYRSCILSLDLLGKNSEKRESLPSEKTTGVCFLKLQKM
jgi:hypothetical protein